MLTTHELARKLFSMPDVPVVEYDCDTIPVGYDVVLLDNFPDTRLLMSFPPLTEAMSEKTFDTSKTEFDASIAELETAYNALPLTSVVSIRYKYLWTIGPYPH